MAELFVGGIEHVKIKTRLDTMYTTVRIFYAFTKLTHAQCQCQTTAATKSSLSVDTKSTVSRNLHINQDQNVAHVRSNTKPS